MVATVGIEPTRTFVQSSLSTSPSPFGHVAPSMNKNDYAQLFLLH